MTTDEELVRALRRLVYTDKLLTLEQAHRYCDLVGIPRRLLDWQDHKSRISYG